MTQSTVIPDATQRAASGLVRWRPGIQDRHCEARSAEAVIPGEHCGSNARPGIKDH